VKISHVLSLIREDWCRHDRDWTYPGFRALAMYRFGRWQVQLVGSDVATRIKRRLSRRVYTSLHRFVRNVYGIELHNTADLGRRIYIPHQGGIVIARYATIGDDCIIRQNVTVGSTERGVSPEEAPRIGNGVELGAGCVILGRVTLGDGARIGANVVVYSDVPAGASVMVQSARMLFAAKATAFPPASSRGPVIASEILDQAQDGLDAHGRT
jgi:serine O-acetyltransferase